MICFSDNFLSGAIFGYIMGCFVWGFFRAWAKEKA
jgi:hypothetical protein